MTGVVEPESTKVRFNKAMQAMPDKVHVDDLHKYHGRQLRNIVVQYSIGDPDWRNKAPKDELIKELKNRFKGEIEVKKNGAPKTRAALQTEAKPAETVAAAPKVEVTGQDELHGLLRPTKDDTFVLDDNLRAFLSAQVRLAKDGRPMNVLLMGPKGCGKTETAIQFAARTGMPLLKMSCAMVREARDWFGSKYAEDGRVAWRKSLFAKVVERGNVVIVLDEINRATPAVLNSLLPMLDRTACTYVEEAEELLVVGPNVHWFATANIGAEYSGTFRFDSALFDRFGARIECTFLPPDKEAKLLVDRTGIELGIASRLVKVASAVRNENQFGGKLSETISTRTLLDVAQMYRHLEERAFFFTVLPMFPAGDGKTSERAQVMTIVQGQFPNVVKVQ
jgi:nitric oxide reductase NorQ protein